MTKELEALKELQFYKMTNGFFYTKDGFDITTDVQMKLDIIESALIQAQKDKKELKEIKSAINQGTLITQWSHDYNHEKELKALEIINKKNVCISTLKDSDTVEEYNNVILYHKVRSMTYYKPLLLEQEEFDLLKEILL